MKEARFEFQYKVYDSIEELPEDQQLLLNKAKEVTDLAYAPYSKFKVGAVAKLANGDIIKGTNQENASFPVGLCAERVLLSTLSSLYPNVAINTIAISYKSENQVCDHPVSPCGICRQSLQEFESRVQQPIQLVLGGLTGPVYVLESAGHLLPLAFTSEELT